MARARRGSAKSEAKPAPAHPSAKRGVQASDRAGRTPVIRAAGLEDLEALLALEARFPGDRLSRRQFRHHLGSPNASLRIVEDGGIAGYSMLLRHGQRAAWRLYSIVVDPARRGQGLGARLLQDAVDRARAGGAPALTLEVREDNPAALALYRAHGFVQSAVRPGYYDDGAAAVCLRRAL